MRKRLEHHDSAVFILAVSLAATALVPLISLSSLAKVFVSVGQWGHDVLARGLQLTWPGIIVLASAGLMVWIRNLRYRIIRRGWGNTGPVTVALITGALIVGCVVILPSQLVSWDGGEPLSPAVRIKAVNDVRGTLLQAIAGLLLTAGAVATWRQLRIAREGQITERFTRAVDQIGDNQTDIRLGGIYALERIMKDSRADLSTVTEILIAYLLGHTPWPPRLAGQYRAHVPIEDLPSLEERAPDVQAAIGVLARRWIPRGYSWALRLHAEAVDLRKAALVSANFKYANLSDAHLEASDLQYADLEGANLVNADLRSADLFAARCLRADLRGAKLEGARLMSVSGLDEADLKEATADRDTIWPYRFDPLHAGVTFKRQPGSDEGR